MSFSLASTNLFFLSTRHTFRHVNRRALIQSQCRFFSGTSQQGMYDEMLQAASEIKDYNYRSYFTRRVTQDMQEGKINWSIKVCFKRPKYDRSPNPLLKCKNLLAAIFIKKMGLQKFLNLIVDLNSWSFLVKLSLLGMGRYIGFTFGLKTPEWRFLTEAC